MQIIFERGGISNCSCSFLYLNRITILNVHPPITPDIEVAPPIPRVDPIITTTKLPRMAPNIHSPLVPRVVTVPHTTVHIYTEVIRNTGKRR